MFSGAGTPLNDILTALQKSNTGRSGESLPYKNNDVKQRGESRGLNDMAGDDLRDLVSLSEEAQDRLRQGMDTLAQALRNKSDETGNIDVALLKERMGAAREQVEFLTALLKGGAGPEQAPLIARSINELGQALEKIGRDLGLETVETGTDSLSIEAVSISLSFNQIAQVQQEDGSIAEYRQSLDIELSFVNITASSSSVTAYASGPGGLSTAVTQEQSNLNITAQTVNYEASAAISKPVATTSVMDDFRVTAKNFRQLVDEFEKSFTDEERVPPNLYNIMRKMVQAVLQGEGKKDSQVNQVA